MPFSYLTNFNICVIKSNTNKFMKTIMNNLKKTILTSYISIIFLLLTGLVIFPDSTMALGSSTAPKTTCTAVITPDLLIQSSNDTIELEISNILNEYQDNYLGTSAPSTSELSTAIADYDKLNIVVTDSSITGNTVKNNYKTVKFLKVFANHLRHNPQDTTIRKMANNVVWLVTDQICQGLITTDGASTLYSFDDFSRPAALISRHFNDTLQTLFEFALHEYDAFDHFWEPVYDFAYQTEHESISTDIMYILGESLMVFSANQPTEEKRYLWMRGYKRWVERFSSYSSGTANGIKPDGTGFHHWTAYDNYMYAFKSASNVIYYLSGTSFQIEKDNYLRFRDAVYAQIIYSNERQVKALSQCGRKPHSRDAQYSESSLEKLAIAGGLILELPTADTILAGEFNRIFGVSTEFNFNSVAPLSNSSGYFQFNHANMGIYRKDNWIATMKGFTNGLWGAELYPTTNRYGRYQSYGTLEIIYPGTEKTGNGYDIESWNWNYNPGTTTIVLPWAKLHGEKARIDEKQKNGFAGSLAFQNKNSMVLSKTHGTLGVFGMDFQELANQGFSTVYGANTHNSTFTFKKSTFVFDDMIVCLGSDINNNDEVNPTVTTLFQRLDNKTDDLWANGNSQVETTTFSGNSDNWLISNYKTGFYLVAGNNDTKVWNGEQQTPNQDQINPADYTNNKKAKYWLGYIDHGTNPTNAEYEYVVIPEATPDAMVILESRFQSENKPYTVHYKNSGAHVVEHKSGVWGYSIFKGNSFIHIPGAILEVNEPCLIMCEPSAEDSTLRLAVSNPVLGIESRSFQPIKNKVIEITLKGQLNLTNTDLSDVEQSFDGQNTTIKVTTKMGLPVELTLTGYLFMSIDENSEGANNVQVKVYPNPAKHQITLDGNFPVESKWTLMDYCGQNIDEGLISSQKNHIDVSDVLSGMYFISVTKNNKLIYTSKIIVN